MLWPILRTDGSVEERLQRGPARAPVELAFRPLAEGVDMGQREIEALGRLDARGRAPTSSARQTISEVVIACRGQAAAAPGLSVISASSASSVATVMVECSGASAPAARGGWPSAAAAGRDADAGAQRAKAVRLQKASSGPGSRSLRPRFLEAERARVRRRRGRPACS